MQSMDLQGASRISGGIFRGRATGNAPNAADLSAIASASDAVAVRGTASVYQCSTGPGDAGKPGEDKADFTIKVEFTLDPQVLCDLLLQHGSISPGKYTN